LYHYSFSLYFEESTNFISFKNILEEDEEEEEKKEEKVIYFSLSILLNVLCNILVC